MKVSIMLGVFTSLFVGCAHEHECPSGYERDGGDCVPSDASGGAGGTGTSLGGGAGEASSSTGAGVTGDGSGGAQGDAGAAGDDGTGDDVATGGIGGTSGESGTGGGGCSVPQQEALGTSCASDDDCACSAPLCAKSPFDDYGFCTEGDCDPDDDQCPEAYHCVEIAIANITYCAPDE